MRQKSIKMSQILFCVGHLLLGMGCQYAQLYEEKTYQAKRRQPGVCLALLEVLTVPS